MTTYLRTLLLLGFTVLTGSLSGCFVETTHDRAGPGCAVDQYFQVYWSVEDLNGPFPCGDDPPSYVRLVTNHGNYEVGKQCRLTKYMGFVFDFAGSTLDGIPVGTYVIRAELVSDPDGTVLSKSIQDPGGYRDYSIAACSPMTHAFAFAL
jgi:hypothetical protein